MDSEVGYGSQTTANHQYGEGMLTQIYIPGYDANEYHIAKRDVFLFQAEKERVLQVNYQVKPMMI